MGTIMKNGVVYGGGSGLVSAATADTLGGIKSGNDILVSEEGIVTVNSVNGKTVGVNVPADAQFTDTKYTLPVATSSALGGIKSGGNISINSEGIITVNSVNGKTVGTNVPADAVFTDTTYSTATTEVAGLMSAADKKKLNYQLITDRLSGSIAFTADSSKTTTVQIPSNYNGILVISESYSTVNSHMFALVEPMWYTGSQATGHIFWFIRDISDSICVNSVSVITKSSSLCELTFSAERIGFPGSCSYTYYKLNL